MEGGDNDIVHLSRAFCYLEHDGAGDYGQSCEHYIVYRRDYCSIESVERLHEQTCCREA